MHEMVQEANKVFFADPGWITGPQAPCTAGVQTDCQLDGTGIPHTVDKLFKLMDTIITPAPRPGPASSSFSGRWTFPMNTLLSYVSNTAAGLAAFSNPAINGALKEVLMAWNAYLSSPASAHVLTTKEWLGVSEIDFSLFKHDKKKPHWGWVSWNDFFTRTLVPDARPIATAPGAISSAADGHISNLGFDLARRDSFWVKEQSYSLEHMLQHHTHLVAPLVGGTLVQVYLGATDYHRWHAPVSGRVVAADHIPGLYFGDACGCRTPDGNHVITEIQTRAIIAILTESHGLVVLIPVGMSEVSTVVVTVKTGDQVQMGEQLGTFQFGGSTTIRLTQKGAITEFKDAEGKKIHKSDKVKMGQQIALMHQVIST